MVDMTGGTVDCNSATSTIAGAGAALQVSVSAVGQEVSAARQRYAGSALNTVSSGRTGRWPRCAGGPGTDDAQGTKARGLLSTGTRGRPISPETCQEAWRDDLAVHRRDAQRRRSSTCPTDRTQTHGPERSTQP